MRSCRLLDRIRPAVAVIDCSGRMPRRAMPCPTTPAARNAIRARPITAGDSSRAAPGRRFDRRLPGSATVCRDSARRTPTPPAPGRHAPGTSRRQPIRDDVGRNRRRRPRLDQLARAGRFHDHRALLIDDPQSKTAYKRRAAPSFRLLRARRSFGRSRRISRRIWTMSTRN